MDYQTLLTHFGLEPAQVTIYVALIENGEMHVGAIKQKTGLSRAGVYDALLYLEGKLLVTYRKQGRNAFYKAAHPTMLFTLAEEQKRTQEIRQKELEESVRQLTGTFALGNNKPGVRVFEGLEGFKESLKDTLTATETVYTFLDFEAIENYAKEVNDNYVIERRKKNIQKNILCMNTKENQRIVKSYGTDATNIRFMPTDMPHFATGIQIYNNKILFSSLRKDNMVSMIIYDPQIYTLHRGIFSFLWNISTPISQTPHPTQTLDSFRTPTSNPLDS